jgi:hypothetical protein
MSSREILDKAVSMLEVISTQDTFLNEELNKIKTNYLQFINQIKVSRSSLKNRVYGFMVMSDEFPFIYDDVSKV